MKLSELEAAFRQRVNDEAAPYLWSQPEVWSFANQAEREAAERANLLEDSTTTAVCLITGLVNTATYNLHAKIIEVQSVRWNGKLLRGVSRDRLDSRHPSGWVTTTGDPCEFIDLQERVLTLYPIPTTAANINLSVYRLPLADMAAAGTSPEVHERYHFGLLDWMECLAYLKHDPETFDAQKSATADQRFTARFGPKVDANTRRMQRERRTHQVRMNPDW